MGIDLRIVRNLTGWPTEVPDDLLYAHVDEAESQAANVTGLSAAPTGGESVWERGIAWLAAASALPSLHVFSLSGAAKVGRLEGGVEFRFLTPTEIDARVTDWRARGLALLSSLVTVTGQDASGDPSEVQAGDVYMGAV